MHTTPATHAPSPASRLAAAAAGMAFALVPTIGPFAAVLILFSRAPVLKRQDVLWLLAALVSIAPVLVHGGGTQPVVGSALPVVTAWLIYRSFGFLPMLRRWNLGDALSTGMLVGLALSVLFGWLQNTQIALAYRSFAQAVSWTGSSALYGHTVLVLGSAVALFMPGVNLRLTALGVTALGVLASGSREAGLAWLVFAILFPLVDKGVGQKHGRRRYYSALALLLGVFAVLGSLAGWGRAGFLVDVVPIATVEHNLIQASEFPGSQQWRAHGVEITELPDFFPAGNFTTINVSKILPEPWIRLQQVIDLETHEPYTASVWLRSDHPEARPGIQGWAELANGDTLSIIAYRLGTEWRTSTSGSVDILSSGILETAGEWVRYAFTFAVTTDESPVSLFFGLAPDNRHVAETSANYAGFQLEEGETATDYIPGSAIRGVSLGAGRLPFWNAAWSGFLTAPLLGNSEDFPSYFAAQGHFRSRIQELPAHAHNQYLSILYRHGLTGLLAFALLVLALSWPAANRRDRSGLLLLGMVLFINIFDNSFFYGGVLYPLSAVLGLRAAVMSDTSDREEQRFANFTVNLILAASALLAPVFAVMGLWTIHAVRALIHGDQALPLSQFLTPAFLYLSLLWPAFTWREGLFPGYGSSAPQQLRRQVTAAVLAGLISIIISLQLPHAIPLSFRQLLVVTLLALALLPLLQALTRRLLARTAIWADEVVILGAGRGGSRLAHALACNPLIGYRPVAFFDDDLRKHGTTIHGVSVLGALDDAVSFSEERGINHAIIAIPSMPAELVGRFMDVTGRRFKRVQFVPDLPGMPAEDVSAGNLDGMLTIEFNNGLFSIANQTFKRLIDVIGALVGGALLAIPLFIIGLLIRLETKGPSLHRGKRLGKDGQLFECLKFRTMVHNADEVLVQLLAKNPDLRAEYELYHKLEDDPRITRIGRFLRRFSIDELPQLWNVLKGEMSLVGPRPYLDRELSVMGPAAEVILQAKPGITGLWQVSGRNELSFEERLELESHYVRNWTIWWDIIIIGQTVNALISRRGAK